MEVKSRKRGRPSKDENRLQKSLIIKTAGEMTLQNKSVPSIRKLASELNVDPMAIYYYFSNKQALLEAVSISLITSLYVPDNKIMWKKNIMNLCQSYITLLLDYPDLISIILSDSTEGAAAVFSSRFEDCVEELALSKKKKETVTHLLADYIHGFALGGACNITDKPVTPELAEGPLSFIIDNIP